jgi:Questin oxidase-like
VLAIYALGASPELIKDAYHRTHLPKLLPVPVSPECITEKNFTEHLGDEKYIVSLM